MKYTKYTTEEDMIAAQDAEHIRQLRNALRRSREDLIWCRGSADFGPGGKAHKGWKKGPAKTLKIIKGLLGTEYDANDLIDRGE